MMYRYFTSFLSCYENWKICLVCFKVLHIWQKKGIILSIPHLIFISSMFKNNFYFFFIVFKRIFWNLFSIILVRLQAKNSWNFLIWSIFWCMWGTILKLTDPYTIWIQVQKIYLLFLFKTFVYGGKGQGRMAKKQLGKDLKDHRKPIYNWLN